MRHKQPRTRVQIPASIYLKNPVTQTDRLSQLPSELGRMVRDHLLADADKTCLALTCKANAEFFECVQKKTRQQPHTLIKKVNFMLRLRGFKGTRKTRLCFNCAKFMLVAGAWRGRSGLEKVKAGEANAEHVTQGPRCPPCVRHEQLKQAEIAELNRLIDQEKTVGVRLASRLRIVTLKTSIRRHRKRCK